MENEKNSFIERQILYQMSLALNLLSVYILQKKANENGRFCLTHLL